MNLLVLVIFVIVVRDCSCNWFKSLSRNSRKVNQSLLLPIVPSDKDSSYLIEFVADGDNNCEQMEPVVRRLENDLRTNVKRLDILINPEYNALFEYLKGPEGGNLPFFYNRRTAHAACGPMVYTHLKEWARGAPGSHFVYSLEDSAFPPKQPIRTKELLINMMGGGLFSRLGVKRAGLGTQRKRQ